MRIISASATNFASYKELDFDFTNQGLTLIQGATGSGKSTLCDLVPWVLEGITAKGGKVDEIRSWNSDDDTFGSVTTDKITVCRIRGSKNDLYFSWNIEPNPYKNVHSKIRGKDLIDTQKMINTALGFDADLYLAGAYYHEFSQTAQFFTTTAKNRRSICEQLVDLSLAVRLTTSLSERLKQIKLSAQLIEQEVRDNAFMMAEKQKSQTAERDRAEAWFIRHQSKLMELGKKNMLFDSDQAQALATYLAAEKAFLSQPAPTTMTCDECGSIIPANTAHKRYNPWTSKIEAVLARENTYKIQIDELKAEVNPYSAEVKDYQNEINALISQTNTLKEEQTKLSIDIADIDLLQEVVQDYRSVSISNTITYIETQTNRLLSDHFDAEIRVVFSVESADKLDIEIYKDGNIATFTQLSKGQRCLLKLCFGLAVMQAVQNHHGIKFEQIFLDESLSGLDDILKIKAFELFQELSNEYDSIFIIDHNQEFKARFENSYEVKLINGHSVVTKA